MPSLQQQIADAISGGKVFMLWRVRNRRHGGRQLISVGPYRTAVSPGYPQYACIDAEGTHITTFAATAAGWFIAAAGRARAREAAGISATTPRRRKLDGNRHQPTAGAAA